jgi:hypothetical protein
MAILHCPWCWAHMLAAAGALTPGFIPHASLSRHLAFKCIVLPSLGLDTTRLLLLQVVQLAAGLPLPCLAI